MEKPICFGVWLKSDIIEAEVCNRIIVTGAVEEEFPEASGEIRSDLKAYELMRGVGNLCIGAESDPRYDARRLVELLIAGLRRPN